MRCAYIFASCAGCSKHCRALFSLACFTSPEIQLCYNRKLLLNTKGDSHVVDTHAKGGVGAMRERVADGPCLNGTEAS